MAEWYDTCEWNEQDTRRTLEHADKFLRLWLDGYVTGTDERVADAIESITLISARWRSDDEPTELARALWQALTEISTARNDAPERCRGQVAQINSSTGGVPKTAIPTASVGWRGIDGDVQHSRVHHGRPWQALSLWSADVIDDLAAAGHPVVPGGAGENLTLRGLDWAALRGGTVVDIGTVRCQLTAPAVPCSKVAYNFIDDDLSLLDHDSHPESTRWYAAVLRPGSIAAGDIVTVSPAAD